MRDVSLKIICFLKEVRKPNHAVFTTYPEKRCWNALIMTENTKDRMFQNVKAGKDPKGVWSTPLVGSLSQVTVGQWLRGPHSSGLQLWMTAHDPSVSVVLVNINDCVGKTRSNKGQDRQRLHFPAESLSQPHTFFMAFFMSVFLRV